MEKSERLGLSVAVVGHIALFGVLSLGIASRTELKMPVEPISVQLTDEVGLVSTAPKPVAEAATATAPEIAPEIEKAAPEPEPTPAPPVKRPEPPAPKAVERPAPPTPKAVEKPKPKPVPKPARTSPPPPAKPQPKAAEKPAPPKAKPAAPTNTDTRRRPDRPTPAPAAKAPRAPRIGSNFLDGVTDKPSTSRAQTPPASVAGPAVVASLQRELLRQVKPHWVPPTGADADQLRTKVNVRLDEAGNIVGTPTATTTGVTASNRSQEALHKERAIAAVRRAAPFKFPPQFYSEWQTIQPTFYLGL